MSVLEEVCTYGNGIGMYSHSILCSVHVIFLTQQRNGCMYMYCKLENIEHFKHETIEHFKHETIEHFNTVQRLYHDCQCTLIDGVDKDSRLENIEHFEIAHSHTNLVILKTSSRKYSATGNATFGIVNIGALSTNRYSKEINKSKILQNIVKILRNIVKILRNIVKILRNIVKYYKIRWVDVEPILNIKAGC